MTTTTSSDLYLIKINEVFERCLVGEIIPNSNDRRNLYYIKHNGFNKDKAIQNKCIKIGLITFKGDDTYIDFDDDVQNKTKYVPKSEEGSINIFGNNYRIISNAGNGDCLYLSIIQSFKDFQINSDVDVHALRKLESDKLTIDAVGTMEEDENFNGSKAYLHYLSDPHNVLETYKVLEAYQKFVLTQPHYGNEFTLICVQKSFNIKIIVIKKDNEKIYIAGENEIENEKNPIGYVFLYLYGLHYQLLTYDNKSILLFPEIPTTMKDTIINNEGLKKIYISIDDFKIYADNK